MIDAALTGQIESYKDFLVLLIKVTDWVEQNVEDSAAKAIALEKLVEARLWGAEAIVKGDSQ